MAKKVEIKNIYNLTPIQEGMFFHYLMDKETSTYVEQMVFEIEGKIDIGAFEKSFNILIERHDILRTVFNYKNTDKVLQIVLKNRKAKILVEDVSNLSEEDVNRFVEEFKSSDIKKGFDLTKDILMRLSIIKTGFSSYKVIWTHHHIIIDGWSMGIIINEFFTLYQQAINNNMIELGYVRPYSDYINWLNKQDKEKAKEYWGEYIKGYEGQATLPKSKKLNNLKYNLQETSFSFDKDITRQLVEFSANHEVTLNTIIQCIWGILLQRYNNTDDVIFGSVISGRSPEVKDIEKMVGLFINTIPVRIKCNENSTFLELVNTVKYNALESEKFDYIPLSLIQSATQSNNKLVDHILVFENYPIEKEVESKVYEYKLGFTIKGVSMFSQTNYDFNIVVYPGEKLVLKFSYNKSVYQVSFIERVFAHFDKVVKAVLSNPDVKVCDIDILSEEEGMILRKFNSTKMTYPSEKTIQQLFKEQVLRTPDNIAVKCGNNELTYRELNLKSNQLAGKLKEIGLKNNEIVAIMTDRSVEMIIGIMGILKAGGAYLPIDVEYPSERINYMLEDSGAKILLKKCILNNDVNFTGQVLDLGDLNIYSDKFSDFESIGEPSDLAYLIYTSGSTGKPKGVMIENKSVNNFIFGIANKIAFLPGKTILSLTTISFDIFVLETLLPLTLGLKVVIANEDEQKDPKAFCDLVYRENIDMIQTTPSRIKLFLSDSKAAECMKNLSEIMIGGEPFPEKLYEQLRKLTDAKIYNMYGPTETTVWSTLEEINNSSEINIGKPISNTQIYILDKNNNLQPIGVIGELCIAGDGLARGYFNNENLTKEKFIPNPFCKGERIYKTGDLARWLEDGRIDCLGRLDNQVKIRGYRIELGEIEAYILRHKGVVQAIVVPKSDSSGNNFLCAYIVYNGVLNVSDLKRYLEIHLPAYMVPSFFIQVDNIPTLPNGKIDRKFLPEPGGDILSTEQYIKPSDEYEEKLLGIMENVLERDKMGVTDNFFEFGGHSLNATMLVSRINKEFQVEVPLKEIYRKPTVKELAKYIRNANKNNIYEILPTQKSDYYPLSSSQKRLYILNQIEDIGTNYNMPSAIRIEGKIDIEFFKEALGKLIDRHETLRTSFHIVNGEPVQKINSEVKIPFTHVKVREEDIDDLINDYINPFKLDNAPLFKIILFELQNDRYILLFDIHHIIADGISISIIINDLLSFYRGITLHDLPIQYKDFAAWQSEFNKSAYILKQAKYWEGRFSGELPILNLPTDYPRPLIQKYDGDSIEFSIEKDLLLKLREISLQQDSTLYMVLVTAYYILLHKYTSQEDIIIGIPVSKRQSIELESVVGMFVNTLALRNYPSSDKTFFSFLDEVKTSIIEGFENQDYQFEDLVDSLAIKRDLSRNPLFDTMFVMQNYTIPEMQINDLKISSYNFKTNITKFDITLEVVENGDSLNLKLEYCTALFNKETMERFANHYLNILTQIAEAKKLNKKIAELSLITEQEKDIIINSYNETRKDYPLDVTLQQLFEESVNKYAQQTALIYEDKYLSYEQLNKRSNQLARHLKSKNIGPNSIIGIMVERSFDMIIGIMGILKAGGAYLPIDPNYPKERIKYILEDSNCNILLTHNNLAKRIDFSKDIIDIGDSNIYIGDDTNLYSSSSSNDLAYIIYTSGSTGNPKGVMIEHKSAVNILLTLQDEYPLNQTDSYLLKTNFTFDVSVTEIFGWFFGGGKLVILKDGDEKDSRAIIEMIRKYNITHINFVPSMLNLFINLLRDTDIHIINKLKYLLVAGEAISKETVRNFRKIAPNVMFENLYGPTETTIYATRYSLSNLKDEINVPIGKPLNNISVYIVDSNDQLQPIGVPGELCISGVGMARGYLNRFELTSEKFVQNPFRPNEKMYKTGDIARWLSDGNIEFLGRRDFQVKVRGYRIELGEIEAYLQKHEQIDQAVVVVKDDKEGDKYICAYIVSKEELIFSEIREYLAKRVPNYMIPAQFVRLESIPLTSSGKADIKALPDPERSIVRENVFEAPRNNIEEIMVDKWSQVLKIAKLGINDNFFDLGGDSLKALRIILELEKSNLKLKINDIFKYQTIKSIYEKVFSQKVTTLKQMYSVDVEEILLHDLNLKSKMIKENIDGDEFLTLFVEESELYTDEYLIKYLREKVHISALPHKLLRVCDINSIHKPMDDTDSHKEPELISEHKINEIINRIDHEINDYENALAEMVIRKGIQKKLSLSYIQKVFLNSNFSYSGMQIKFDTYLDITRLQKAILKLVREHEMLRSTLSIMGSEIIRLEYNKPDEIVLPFIDLSSYSIIDRKKIIERFIPKYYFKEYKLDKHLLFRMVLIKEDLRNYRLVIPFHHAIFDGMSGDIIESQLLQYYKDSENAYTLRDYNESYESYFQQLREGPKKIDEDTIILSFELQKFKEYTIDFIKSIEKYKLNNYMQYIFEIPFDKEIEPEQTDEMWNMAFNVVVGFMKEHLEIKSIPVTLFNYGRSYNGKSYFNTVGNFLDFIPIVIESDQYQVEDIGSLIKEKLHIASKHNINFNTLLFDDALSKEYSKIHDMLVSSLNSMITVNFHGLVSDEIIETANEIDTGYKEHLKKNIRRDSQIDGIFFDFMYSKKLLRISINCPLGILDEKFNINDYLKSKLRL